MTRRGSHSTRSPQDAGCCCVCGQRLVVSRQSCRFATSAGIGWHSLTCDKEGWAALTVASRRIPKGAQPGHPLPSTTA